MAKPYFLERRRRLVTAAAAGAALTLLGSSGCALRQRAAEVPMPSIRLAHACARGGGHAPVLLVMMPGAYSLPAEFIDEGFVLALRERGINADVAIADAHLAYFSNGSVVRRLREDIVEPARAQGYQQVWLVGISLGGFGALAYASSQGQTSGAGVDGVLALAPYLGSQRLQSEISAAGGPAAWAATMPAENAAAASAHPIEVAERSLWRWLAAPPPGAPPVYLGFGSEDRLGAGHRLLAAHLAPERVIAVPGGHDWPPWRALWQQWLALGLLPWGCSPQPRA